jgi:uncharacterized protein YbaP (TraB family)
MVRAPVIQAYKEANIVATEVRQTEALMSDPAVLISALSMLGTMSKSFSEWQLSVQNRLEIADTLKSLVTRLVPMLCKVRNESIYEVERTYGYTSSVNNAIKNIKTDSAMHLIGLVVSLKEELSSVTRKFNGLQDAPMDLEETSTLEEAMNFFDSYVWKSAREDGKRTVELDEMQQVLSLVPSITGAFLSDPMKIVRDVDYSSTSALQTYLNEDINQLYDVMRKELDAKSFEQMLDVRNRKWIAKLKPLLESNRCFVAVGAGHLAGEKGLIKLLRSLGMRVDPVLGGDRIDIKQHIGGSPISPVDRKMAVGHSDSNESAFSKALKERMLKHLRQTEEHGQLTIVLSIVRTDKSGYVKSDVLSIDFIDRDDMRSEIQMIITETAASSSSYLELETDHTYNLMLQIEY